MQPFQQGFTAPTWQHVLVLIVGAILTRASYYEGAQIIEMAGKFAIGAPCYWLQATPRRSNAFCWIGVGLVSTVRG